MHIAFRVDSGEQIGMGHVTRMGALADAFVSLFNAQVTFFQSQDEPVDYAPYDLIILDSYLLSDAYIAKLHNPAQTLVCYDDNALYTYDCDVILNANLHAAELAYATSSPPPAKLLGGKYALLRREFWSISPIIVKECAQNVFVCFGGSDPNNQTPVVVEALQNIPGLSLHIVLGKKTSCDNNVEALANSATTVYKDPPSIAAVMQRCDVAVVSASSIVYELAALGIPMLTIVQAQNQVLIAEYLHAHDLAQNIGSYTTMKPQTLCREANNLLLHYNRRKQLSHKLRNTVESKGALYAATAIKRIMDETT